MKIQQHIFPEDFSWTLRSGPRGASCVQLELTKRRTLETALILLRCRSDLHSEKLEGGFLNRACNAYRPQSTSPASHMVT